MAHHLAVGHLSCDQAWRAVFVEFDVAATQLVKEGSEFSPQRHWFSLNTPNAFGVFQKRWEAEFSGYFSERIVILSRGQIVVWFDDFIHHRCSSFVITAEQEETREQGGDVIARESDDAGHATNGVEDHGGDLHAAFARATTAGYGGEISIRGRSPNRPYRPLIERRYFGLIVEPRRRLDICGRCLPAVAEVAW
jgi:hypothetical protein